MNKEAVKLTTKIVRNLAYFRALSSKSPYHVSASVEFVDLLNTLTWYRSSSCHWKDAFARLAELNEELEGKIDKIRPGFLS